MPPGRRTAQNARVVNQTSQYSWRNSDFTVHKSRWARLPFGVRMTVGGLALLLPCVGGIFAISTALSDTGPDQAVDRYTSIVTSDSHTNSTPTGGIDPVAPGATGIDAGAGTVAGLGGAPGVPNGQPGADTAGGVAPGSTAPAAAPGAPQIPGGSPTPDSEMPMGGTPVDPTTDYEPPPPQPPAPVPPVVETRTVTETEAVPFETQFIRDPSMPRRTYEVRVPGEQGVKTLTYEVTTTDGQQTAKRLVSEAVTTDPVTRVVALGTPPSDGDDDGPEGTHEGGDGDRKNSRRCEAPNGGS
jgi:hypothetical protein